MPFWAPTYRLFAPSAYWPHTDPLPAAATIHEALLVALSLDGGLADVVGDRIYPDAVPKGVAGPAAAYQLVSLTRERGLRGANGIARAWFQLTCTRASRAECRAFAEAIRQLFDGYRGFIGDVWIHEALLGVERDLGEAPAVAGSGEPARTTAVDVILRHREPRPPR